MKKTELKIPVEVYSRVVGYFRPVNQWNKGKQEEFRERKEISLTSLQHFISNVELAQKIC